MPLRLITLHGQIATIIEGITLCLLGVWQGVSFAATSIVSDEDWSKLIGPHGALFAVSVGLVVVWLHSAAAERNRQKRADAYRAYWSFAILEALANGNATGEEITDHQLQSLRLNPPDL